MARLFQSKERPQSNDDQFSGSLTRSLVQTLLLLTVIPLTLMAVAAYLRASTLLQDQAVSQMQTLITQQISQVELGLKIKSIRLDRLVRQADLASDVQLALQTNRQSADFSSIRETVIQEFNTLNVEETSATFSQFMILQPNGTIQLASKAEWEGMSLGDSLGVDALADSEPRSVTIFDLKPLYPDQLVLLTIQPFLSSSGAVRGFIVGVTEPQSLGSILQPLVSLFPSAQAYFVTAKGQLIGVDPYTQELVLLVPSESQKTKLTEEFDKMMGEEEIQPASLEFKDQEGTDKLAQAVWLSNMKAGIVLEVNKSAVLGQINSLVPFTIFILAAALLGMAFVIFAGSRRLINPVIALTKITRRFANGEMSERASITSNDEIGLLAHSFNQMADELGGLYRSLEGKVEERTQQIRTAAEIAQGITASTDLNELFNKTTRLIVERFNYYQASIFLLDRSGKIATVRSSHGPAAKEFLETNHSLEVGSESIIGWVSAKNEARVASDVIQDPMHFKNDLLPETRAEAAIPIASGDLVFGVLDVQSTEPNAFDPETLTVLRTIANQIAAAINNTTLVQSTQVNFQELERLYRYSRSIAQGKSNAEIFRAIDNALKESPFINVIFAVKGEHLEITTLNDPQRRFLGESTSRILNIPRSEILKTLAGQTIFAVDNAVLPPELGRIPSELGCQVVAFIPIVAGEEIAALLMLGSRNQPITHAAIQPYMSMADLAAITLDKIAATEATDDRLRQLNALTSISQIVSTVSQANTLYTTLHTQVQDIIGDYNFTVAIYDDVSDTIHIPYNYEDGVSSAIDPFPLGEGLTSILIHSQQPLLLIEDTERRALAMGAKIVGRSAKSWMGAPMILNGRSIGVLILQDPDNEHAFNESDLRFLLALASQVSGVINTIRLLEESRQRAVQLQTAAEIARDISSSLSLDELLPKAVNFVRDRFNFYYAAMYMLDWSGEFAVIREATGEAGGQLKRSSYKLGVGSKSIVGYVASRGESLIVNDVSKDLTYLANPLLVDTKAEAAIPLKVGDRTLGVLDVQSTNLHSFTEDNLRVLQVLADQLAVAVVNTELFSETQEHLSQHRLLHHITTSAASGSTLEEALDSAVSGLQVTLGGDRVSILLMDREKKNLEVKAAIGYSEDVNNFKFSISNGVTGWVATHRRPLRVDDVTEDPRYIQMSPNTRSELAVPLIYRNEVLGVLNAESEQTGAYTENDQEMLGTLGGSLAAIIANARLLEQVRGQAERERVLFEVTGKIRRSTDVQTILATTASELTRVLSARRAEITINVDDSNPEDGGQP